MKKYIYLTAIVTLLISCSDVSEKSLTFKRYEARYDSETSNGKIDFDADGVISKCSYKRTYGEIGKYDKEIVVDNINNELLVIDKLSGRDYGKIISNGSNLQWLNKDGAINGNCIITNERIILEEKDGTALISFEIKDNQLYLESSGGMKLIFFYKNNRYKSFEIINYDGTREIKYCKSNEYKMIELDDGGTTETSIIVNTKKNSMQTIAKNLIIIYFIGLYDIFPFIIGYY